MTLTFADAVSDLVDMRTVAVRAGVPLSTVQDGWRRRDRTGMLAGPHPPVEVLVVPRSRTGREGEGRKGSVPLFWWSDWQQWLAATGRPVVDPDGAADGHVERLPDDPTPMTRREALDRLIDSEGVAALLGMSLHTVAHWRRHPPAGVRRPEPLKRVGWGVPLWDRREWVAWADATGRELIDGADGEMVGGVRP